MKPMTYPARPMNGGPLQHAVPKVGKWMWSDKLNGWRALVHTPTKTMWNRQGEPLSIAEEFIPALHKLHVCPFEWVDCEAFERRHNLGRGSLLVLDVVLMDTEAYHRHAMINKVACDHNWKAIPLDRGPAENEVYVSMQTIGTDQNLKEELRYRWNILQQVNKDLGIDLYEGFVAKRADSVYPVQLVSPGRECKHWVKHRFV